MMFSKEDRDNQFGDFAGKDLDWYAVDSADDIGYFTSAGFAPIPTAVMAIRDELVSIHQDMQQLPHISQVNVGKHLHGRNVVPGMEQKYAEYKQEILNMGARGLFCFDAEPDGGARYVRLLKPLRPLKLSELPGSLSDLISKVRLNCSFSLEDVLE